MDNSIKSAAEAFAAELMETEVFKDYYDKRKSFKKDDKGSELLFKFNSLRADLMEKQQEGKLTPEDMQELRRIQKELQSTKTYQEVRSAQVQASGLIQEISKELSTHLGFDFGTFAKPPGGCC